MVPGFEKLDRRGRSYQFDLERDIPWERVAEPGLYFPAGYLAKLGVDVAALRRVEGAEPLFQSLLALGVCRVFAHLETDVVVFVQDEHEDLALTRSALVLTTEEEKHTILFHRFAAALEAREPRLAALLDPRYEPPDSFARLRAERAKLGSPAVLHYLFWLNTVFFEELTRHLYRELAAEPASVQPAWLEAHRCHDREEGQHVLTDAAYLRTSPLSAEERDRWSKVFAMHLFASWRRMLALDAVEAALRDAIPALGAPPRPPGLDEVRLLDDLLEGPSFALTRAAAPYLERYRLDRAARRAR